MAAILADDISKYICLNENWRRAIIWPNADPIHWHIHEALGRDELKIKWDPKISYESQRDTRNGNKVNDDVISWEIFPYYWPSMKTVMWSFDVFFVVSQSKLLINQPSSGL